jgi:glucose/arabinose dehydrogenase
MNEPVPVVEKGGASCGDYPCYDDAAGWEQRLRLPPGFKGEYFALLDGQPTSIAFGPDGLLYVALQGGQVMAVDNQGIANLFVDGLIVPVALAFQPGVNRLWISSRVSNTEAQVLVVEGGQITQLLGGAPCCYAGMHAANGIAFGPDGYAYLAVGASADHGEVLNSDVQDVLHPWEASVLRISPDGSEIGVYARGLRNAYDIAWDAAGRLFASDNGPDFGPPDEFHQVLPGSEHGYPWYVCDDCFPPPPDVSVIPPLHELIPHGAPTGITVYLAEQFPGYYSNIFLTLWSAFPGAQKIVRFSPGGEEMTDFATGFAAPIDVTVGPNGSLYVADFATGIIFRIYYEG